MTNVFHSYREFLDRVLPSDYAEREHEYRDDEDLRRRFQVACFEEGWVAPSWPSGLGGRDLDLVQSVGVAITGAFHRVPRYMNIQGTGVVAPSIRQFGTEAQRDRYLRPTLRGDDWWALGMSEPESGSDLASLRTTAVAVPGGYRISGQKTWTTQADGSTWCLLYARTNPDVPKHRGISCFIVDMDTPGITVRPIAPADESIDSFCEVFFDDVFVEEDRLLGEPGQGWRIAIEALNYERDMIWIHNWLELQRALSPVLEDAGNLTTADLAELGRLQTRMEAIRMTGIRSVTERLQGGDDSVSMILKLLGSESVQQATDFAYYAQATDGFANATAFREFIESLAATIYGGTSEVQRNIIGERVLGLPKGT